VTRWVTGLLTIATVGACLVGCGDEADLKSYAEPLRVAERTALYLQGLRDKNLPRPDFVASRDITFSESRALIDITLPSAISTGVKDAALKTQLTGKVEELQLAFRDQVVSAVSGESIERDKAAAGCDHCLAIVDEIRKLLGGK